jgi:formate-dependent nitrite reductase membrane component NrfD
MRRFCVSVLHHFTVFAVLFTALLFRKVQFRYTKPSEKIQALPMNAN